MKKLILLTVLFTQVSISGEFFYWKNGVMNEVECSIVSHNVNRGTWLLNCEKPVPNVTSPAPFDRTKFFIQNPGSSEITKVACPLKQYRVYDRNEYTFIIDCDASSLF